jgi:hypothetical protein
VTKYILIVIDEGTRYPEAFPLPSIEAERIAQSLIQLFSRVGVANESVLSHLQRNPVNNKTEVPSVYIFLVLSDLTLDDHVLTLAQPFLTTLVKQSGSPFYNQWWNVRYIPKI